MPRPRFINFAQFIRNWEVPDYFLVQGLCVGCVALNRPSTQDDKPGTHQDIDPRILGRKCFRGPALLEGDEESQC